MVGVGWLDAWCDGDVAGTGAARKRVKREGATYWGKLSSRSWPWLLFVSRWPSAPFSHEQKEELGGRQGGCQAGRPIKNPADMEPGSKKMACTYWH